MFDVSVFSARHRKLSPRQHIALTCQKTKRGVDSCCYQDQNNTIPSQGIHRIFGEWTVSFDKLPRSKDEQVMAGIVSSIRLHYFYYFSNFCLKFNNWVKNKPNI